MIDLSLIQFAMIVALCFATAFGVYVSLLLLATRVSSGPRYTSQDMLSEPRTFIFRDGYLISHSSGAGFLIPTPVDHLGAWDALEASLSEFGEGVEQAFEALALTGDAFHIEGRLGQDLVHISGAQDGDSLRVSVTAAGEDQTTLRVDRATNESLHRELATLRTATESTPILGWACDDTGRVIWANSAYRTIVNQVEGEEASQVWPLPSLFPNLDGMSTGYGRRKLEIPNADKPSWFELSASKPIEGITFAHAVSLDRVVKAEDSLRTFIQTLTKTFAFLPMGLAIFDREGQLALFNPALMDLTELDGAWLTQRPTLESFFDNLRERQRLPEPKDYKAWRDSLIRLDNINETGTYEETWSLPTGQTYRVTARPHTDGAVALLIEDISAEISVTRKFRSELELFQAVINASDDAMVVFSSAGQVLLANEGYVALWDHDPMGAAGESSVAHAISRWQSDCMPTPIWGDLREFTSSLSDRAEWTDAVTLKNGLTLDTRVTPLPGGMTLITFKGNAVASAERAPSLAFATARVAS